VLGERDFGVENDVGGWQRGQMDEVGLGACGDGDAK